MSIEKITTKIIVVVDERNGRHKVMRQGVNRDTTGTFPDAPFQEPAKRSDIQTILGEEIGVNSEKITALAEELEGKAQEVLKAQDVTENLRTQLEGKDQEIAKLKGKLEKAMAPPKANKLIEATQLRLALLRTGFGPDEIEAELQKLDADDPERAKEVRIIWEYNTHYDRHNPLVGLMAVRAGLSDEQVDALFGIEAQ